MPDHTVTLPESTLLRLLQVHRHAPDCQCPKRDPYLCVAHRFDAGDEAVDADGEEFCVCGCHADWWDENLMREES